MQHIPSDDIKQLYNENKDKSWSGLLSIMRQHKGKAEGIEDSVISTLMMIVQRLDQAKQPYPSSSDDMQRILDSELAKVTA